MPTPRVIFVNRVYRPSTAATAQLLTELTEGLAGLGFDVAVITTGETGAAPDAKVTIHRTGPTRRSSGGWSRLRDARRFVSDARARLRQILRPRDVVVVMTDPPLLGVALTAEVRARGGHVVHWVQDIYPEIAAEHYGIVARLFARTLIGARNRSWHHAAACVVLGEAMAKTLATAGLASQKVRVVPNWAPGLLDTPASAADRERARAAWGVDGKFVVVYSGNLGRVHTFDALIDAADRLQSESSIRFVVVGNGPRLAEVKAACRQRALDNVTFHTPVSLAELPAVLAAGDLQLVTLKPEFAPYVYPSKLAGVLAAGRPVVLVGPPHGEIAALLHNERCGVAFAPDGGAEFAGQIDDWRKQPVLLEEMGRHARRVFESRFTFRHALAAWAQLLQESGSTR